MKQQLIVVICEWNKPSTSKAMRKAGGACARLNLNLSCTGSISCQKVSKTLPQPLHCASDSQATRRRLGGAGVCIAGFLPYPTPILDQPAPERVNAATPSMAQQEVPGVVSS